MWWDWGGGGYRPQNQVLALRLSKQDCLYSILVEGQGVRWEQGGFTSLDGHDFRQDLSGRHVGFVGHVKDDTFVVIDGVKSPPYRGVLWPPSWSPDGRHAGYLAKEGTGAVAVVDGRVVGRAPEYHRGMFEVLDDGRFGAAPKRADGQYEVVVGDVRSPPVDDLCDSHLATVLPSGRFAVVGKRGSAYVPIVNGEEIEAPGVPAGCRIVFSPDGERWGWIALHVGPGGVASREQAAIVDGKLYSLEREAMATEVSFFTGLAIVRAQKADPSGQTLHGYRKWETVHWLVDLDTPAVPPTEDGYFPPDHGQTVEWARVRIGSSVGPRFDRIDLQSLHVDAAGSTHYVGERGGFRLDVVDNVLAPARSQAVAAPEPGAPDPPPVRPAR